MKFSFPRKTFYHGLLFLATLCIMITMTNPATFDPIIKEKAQKYGVDEQLLRAMLHTESGGDPEALSHAGAMGLMQLMPTTAKQYGVELDELHIPERNIDAGAQHIAYLLDRFKDEELALAAYNAGEGNIAKYGGIPPFKETQHYIRKVKARRDVQPIEKPEKPSTKITTKEIMPVSAREPTAPKTAWTQLVEYLGFVPDNLNQAFQLAQKDPAAAELFSPIISTIERAQWAAKDHIVQKANAMFEGVANLVGATLSAPVAEPPPHIKQEIWLPLISLLRSAHD